MFDGAARRPPRLSGDGQFSGLLGVQWSSLIQAVTLAKPSTTFSTESADCCHSLQALLAISYIQSLGPLVVCPPRGYAFDILDWNRNDVLDRLYQNQLALEAAVME